MPYIRKDDRPRALDHPQTVGELNFAVTVRLIKLALGQVEYRKASFRDEITNLLDRFLKVRVPVQGTENYALFNEIMGVFYCVGKEFVRHAGGEQNLGPTDWEAIYALSELSEKFYDTRVAPYEDKKIAQNGDVYPQRR